jgi:NAD(P)-dependent dehydrogenase (short-subunit alcohol dehydrogenase family)
MDFENEPAEWKDRRDQKVFAAMTPLQRMAEPSEIAAAAAFLASSDSSFMTASELAVAGGLAQL